MNPIQIRRAHIWRSMIWAWRDLRGGLGPLRLLLACLMLGVAPMAGVGSLIEAIRGGLQNQGQVILGGDLEVRLTHRAATASERRILDRTGTVSRVARLNAMIGARDDRTLGELKAVDALYPLYGHVGLVGGGQLKAALRDYGAVVVAALAARLGVKPGDHIQIGAQPFRISALIASEPDRVGEGFRFGPSVIIADHALTATQLLQPGALVRYHYRIKTSQDLATTKTALQNRFSDARIQDRTSAAPGVRQWLSQLNLFLGFVSLATLLVSGLGIANAVDAYLRQKSSTIAILKTLGGTSARLAWMYCIQIGLISLAGILGGLLIGASVPWLCAGFLRRAVSLPLTPGLAIQPLALAALLGGLASLAATLWPLARAYLVSAASVLRPRVHDVAVPRRVGVFIVGLLLLLAGVIIASSHDPRLAAYSLGATAVVFGVLRGAGAFLAWICGRWQARAPMIRLVLRTLSRPGNTTAAAVSALGLGLTLLATISVTQATLTDQIRHALPQQAPAFFFLDINHDDAAAFQALVHALPGAAHLQMVPALRGPVTQIKHTPVADFKPPKPDDAWILRGDRGLTYAETPPSADRIVSGQWWPPGYHGPPLVSMEAESAAALGLQVGDTITVSVLGVPLEATIANLRAVDWESMGFNFALIYAPHALRDAPHTFMATLDATPGTEPHLYRAITKRFPTVSALRTKDVFTQIDSIMRKTIIAVQVTGFIAIVAGVLVLIGIIASGQSARYYEASILKILGATRTRILGTYFLEYACVCTITAVIACILGGLCGWVLTTQVLHLKTTFIWRGLIPPVAWGIVVAVGLGTLGTWSVLKRRPLAVLGTA